MIRCWNKKCARTISECEPISSSKRDCPIDLPKLCPDGSCRKSLQDCPTELICPIDKSVRCDDGTCKESR